MRITFVLPNLLLYGGIKSTVQMADALQKLGHEVTIVYPRLPGRDGQPWWRLRKSAVQLVRLLQSFVSQPTWFEFSGELKQVPYLSQRHLPEADVLVLTWWADVAKFASVPEKFGRVLHYVRSYETWGGPPSQVEAVYQLPLPKVTNSQKLAERLPAEPRAVIHNGLDQAFFSDVVRGPKSTVSLGLLYRLQDWKRMDDAFEVLKAVKKRCPELKFIVFGETLKPQHKAELQALGDFKYTHLPTGDELREQYQQMDVFLFTSDETEAFGNPPLEAMAAGCAVVTTKVGAVQDYSVDQVSALHCEPRDIGRMTQWVEQLLTEAELRERLGENARAAALDYRWDAQAQKFSSVLEQLVATSEERV